MNDNLEGRTLKSLKWSGIGQVVKQLMYFMIYIVLARLLTPQDFGIIGMVMVFTGFVQIFSELGLGAALVQKLDLDERHLSSVFWVNLGTGVLLTGVIATSAPLIAAFYGNPVLRPITMVIALNFFIGSFKVVQNALLQKKMDFQKLACVEIIGAFIAGFVAISMALMGFGVWSLVVQSLLFTLVSVVMIWIFSSWRPVFCWDAKAVKELVGFSSNLLGFNVLNYWVRNFDNLLVGKFIGPWALGIYTRAYGLMLLPVSQISAVISRVMFPALSSIQEEVERVKKVYLRSTRIIALFSFPLMVGLFVLAEPFIIAVLGEKWRQVVPVLQILCISGLGQSVGSTVGWIYNSQGRTDLQFKWGMFSAAVRIIAFTIGLHWGIIGVASAYVISGYVILWYPAWTIPGKLINLSFFEMLKNLSSVFYCAVAMGIAIWGSGLIFSGDSPYWMRLAVQVPFGVIVYFILVHVFRLKAYIDIRQVIKDRLFLKK